MAIRVEKRTEIVLTLNSEEINKLKMIIYCAEQYLDLDHIDYVLDQEKDERVELQILTDFIHELREAIG